MNIYPENVATKLAMNDSSSSPSPSSSAQASSEEPPRITAFERWRRNAMLATGLGGTDEERAEYRMGVHTKNCEKMKEELMTSSLSFTSSVLDYELTKMYIHLS